MNTTATRVPLASLTAYPMPDSPDELRATIARLGGYCDWRLESSGWTVTLHLPQERIFTGPTLEAALAMCVDWLTPTARSGLTSGAAVRDGA